MKKQLIISALLVSSVVSAQTPVDGWYAEAFGGYTYLPSNISTTRDTIVYTNGQYDSGYHFGGKVGYKSTPIRYEAEVSYLTTQTKGFDVNGIPQTGVTGNSNATLGFANLYYDLSDLSDSLEPYFGLGIGGAWLDSRFYSTGPLTNNRFKATNTVFAYNATVGITYNFSENYALDASYRYVGSARGDEFGKTFQAHQLSVGAIYRFDVANYK
jgi:opacity protein-like surface antigen